MQPPPQPVPMPASLAAPQTVVVQGPALPAPASSQVINSRSVCLQAVGLGAAHIVLGVLCLASNVGGIAVGSDPAIGASGIWCGIMFIITGPFGIAAGKRKTRGWFTAFLVLSIISASLTLFPVIQSCVGLAVDNDQPYYEYKCTPDYFRDYNHRNSENCYYQPVYPNRTSRLFFHSALLVCSLLEAAVSIWSSIIGCKVACCCCRKNNIQGGQLIYYQAGNQQVLSMNQGQAGMGVPQQPVVIVNPQQNIAQYPPAQAGYMASVPPTTYPTTTPASSAEKQAL